MGAVRILIMCIAVTALPATIGTLFSPGKERAGILSCWISGQMLIWAGFECICVPLILSGKSYALAKAGFFLYVGALAVLAAVCAVFGKKRPAIPQKKEGAPKPDACCAALWLLFFLLLGVQLFLLCFLAFADGDDAFYVAVATLNRGADKMYTRNPYSMGYMGLDIRHALAPMPIWVAMISDLAGLSVAATAHVALPLLFLPMTYAVYYLLGKKLFGGEEEKPWQMPLYLCFAALLVWFGGYSIHPAEKFLLTRSAQGKAVLANLVIPFLICRMLELTRKLDRGEQTTVSFWILTGVTMTAGCLCSTLGSLLLCLLLGVTSLCACAAYRRWKPLLGALACMAVPMVFIVLYIIL